MLQLIGIGPQVKIEVREKLALIPKGCERALAKLGAVCDEAVIVSTCNRTEVYFNSYGDEPGLMERIFNCLGWNVSYMKYVFSLKGDEVVHHLMEVACGFDSLLPGEDQILGQIKDAFETSRELETIHGELLRLFQTAITCGKEFRDQSQLYKIPVSLVSIVVREARKRNIRSFMILGYGEMGKLAARYVMDGDFDALYLVNRNTGAVDIAGDQVKVIPFEEKSRYYDKVDCIISCTSAPHVVIVPEQLPRKSYLIFDMAVPRDVHEEIYEMEDVEVYDTDRIGRLQDENYQKRCSTMEHYRYIMEKHVEEFLTWQKLQELSSDIQQIQHYGEHVYRKRYYSFMNKKDSKDVGELAETLLKSTSNAFVNRAIEVLKEEHLKGRGEECRRIMHKIFGTQYQN